MKVITEHMDTETMHARQSAIILGLLDNLGGEGSARNVRREMTLAAERLPIRRGPGVVAFQMPTQAYLRDAMNRMCDAGMLVSSGGQEPVFRKTEGSA